MKKNKETLSLALCIAVLPPIWAVLAPHIHISTGAAALICAGLYVTNGNRAEDGLKITVGFLLGDLWAFIALHLMDWLALNPDIELFLTLFVLGGLAVLISAAAPKYIYCPSYLCGWAIGLTIMSPLNIDQTGSFFLQIAVAMIIGVWYIGFFLDLVQKKIHRMLNR